MTKTIDEKIDDAVYAAMWAMGLSVRGAPDKAEMLNDRIRDVCAEMLTGDDEDEAADPAKERKFKIIVGRDAVVPYEADITEDSLEAAMRKLTRHGYDCPENTPWIEGDTEAMGNVVYCQILDAETDEELALYNTGSGWTFVCDGA